MATNLVQLAAVVLAVALLSKRELLSFATTRHPVRLGIGRYNPSKVSEPMRCNLPWSSRNAIAMGAVALAVGALAACSGGSSSSPSASASAPADTGPITIGASLSLTPASGNFTADGQAFLAGYKLWQKDVNAHGGLLGRQVVLKILDNQSSPNKVVTDYQTLISTDHVDLTF